jgi:iron-sulfur cluster assembly protein
VFPNETCSFFFNKYCIFALQFRFNLFKDMIKVSDTARKKVVELMTDDGFNATTDFVRVGVQSGGCSGLSYDLTFDNKKEDSDKVFEENNVKIIVDKKSFLYLVGTTLEYSGGLNGKGFVFNNPNANRTCGCGESFSL